MLSIVLRRTALLASCIALLHASTSRAADRPNVILFIADDVSWNDYGCYGNGAARTPNIDELAAGGIRFDRAYLTASSCSPSRSSIITGRYPHNNGKAAELHQPISVHLPWFPEILKQSGYYTALSGKHHMKSTSPGKGESPRPEAFDHVDAGRVKGDSSGSANWLSVTRDRPKDQPFFFWFASYDAHRGWDADKQWKESEYGPMHRAEDVVVPPFLSDDLQTRRDLASYYNEVTRFDYRIGVVVDELRRQGVLDETLIYVLADNGRPFPRAKTRLHDSGMKTALVAHWPTGIQWQGASDQLVSVIDLAPTVLSVAGCQVPETMQGVSMLPLFQNASASVREYAFSEHNWHDYEAFGRSVRHGDHLLIINRRPGLAWQGPADSVRSDSHQQLRSLRQSGSLNDAQADVFLSPRPEVELYDVTSDPHQLNNLTTHPEHAETRQRLVAVLQRWMDETGDSVPDKLSPDTFDRESGKPLAEEAIDAQGAMTPGEDRSADHVNAPGPR
ncbi:sulfatase family protein [Rhodopirellula sp. JC639]|uniref:sulfatase family protein n=1 Tax=Stieleria mannarensis TaxID=2755585 RepID=UPI0016048580|nr:sulfatase [Rhodopirellula sp. JC639]